MLIALFVVIVVVATVVVNLALATLLASPRQGHGEKQCFVTVSIDCMVNYHQHECNLLECSICGILERVEANGLFVFQVVGLLRFDWGRIWATHLGVSRNETP